MRFTTLTTAVAAVAIAGPTASAASAATVAFTGSRENIDAPGPAAARCGLRATTNVYHDPPTRTSVGLSNLGSFTPTLSHCIQLPLSAVATNTFDLGEFSFDFGGGHVLLGTYSGVLNFLAPGQYSVSQTHLVSGGLGDFLGASGSFESNGVLSFLSGRPTVTQTFSGALNLPAVPEPEVWLMLVLGFGATGAALRRRSARKSRIKLAYL